MKKVVILGGGLAGLSAAIKLKDNYEVILIEKEKELGGLASSFKIKDYYIPVYYHHIFSHDSTTIRYVKKYIKEKLNWKRIKMSIWADDAIINFTNPVELLKLKQLSILGKIRYGIFGIYSLTLMNPAGIAENTNAYDWLNKKAGGEVAEKIFKPLYAINKYGIPLEEISARELAFRIKEKEFIGKFGYPTKTFHKLIKNIERALTTVEIIKKAEIQKINLEKNEIIINNDAINYDYLINTMPVPEFLNYAQGLPEDYSKRLRKIKYCSCVEVVFGTESTLTDDYWINIFGRRIGILIQHSNLYDNYKFKVNYALRYGRSEQDYNLTDKEIVKEYLKPVIEKFNQKILWAKVIKTRYATPIYDRDYYSYKPEYTTPISNLFFAGVAVTYPKIRNMNTALESGERVAEIIKNEHN